MWKWAPGIACPGCGALQAPPHLLRWGTLRPLPGAPDRRVPPPTGAAVWVAPGAGTRTGLIWEVGASWSSMEADPAPDFLKLRGLLAQPRLDPKLPPDSPVQQAPRTPGCGRPSGRCVNEKPLPGT